MLQVKLYMYQVCTRFMQTKRSVKEIKLNSKFDILFTAPSFASLHPLGRNLSP